MSIISSLAVDTLNKSSVSIFDKIVIIIGDDSDGDYIFIKDALSHTDSGITFKVYSGIYYEYDKNNEIEDINLRYRFLSKI